MVVQYEPMFQFLAYRDAALLAWAGSLAAGALSHYYLEAPFLRLKRRWERGQSAPAAAVLVAAAA
jgi:peptidoglycan/LPS O-acetylase OafA/YrhL